jgi:cholesterol transport system auxiliary component
MSMQSRLPASMALAAMLALAGCVSVEVGNDAGAPLQYRLVDTAKPVAAPRPIGRELLVAPVPSTSVDDSFALAFSRGENQRAPYQFATWSERPSNRVAQLLVERLAARRAFTSVALLGRGVGGELQLNLAVNDFFHDAASSPGTARVEVTAELVDRSTRKLIARERFAASAPAAQANAASAATALGAATTQVLDQLVAWLEKSVAPPALALRD